MKVIITGNPVDGFELIGPFDSEVDETTLDKYAEGGDWWVADLIDPNRLIPAPTTEDSRGEDRTAALISAVNALVTEFAVASSIGAEGQKMSVEIVRDMIHEDLQFLADGWLPAQLAKKGVPTPTDLFIAISKAGLTESGWQNEEIAKAVLELPEMKALIDAAASTRMPTF